MDSLSMNLSVQISQKKHVIVYGLAFFGRLIGNIYAQNDHGRFIWTLSCRIYVFDILDMVNF